jgi:hypothetical protein
MQCIAELANRKGQKVLQGAERAIVWFRENDFLVEATRSQDALVAQDTRADGKSAWPFFIRRSTGRLETALGYLMYVPAFKSDEARKKVLDRIRALPTNSIKATEKLNGFPSIALEELLKDELWTVPCP